MKTEQSIVRFMKKLPLMLGLLVLATLLGACATAGAQAAPSPQPAPTTAIAGQGGMDTLPVSMAKSLLADKLNINVESIKLVDSQSVQWPDSCLGVHTPGIMCAMHVVDGFKITLSANGHTYEVHTNQDGSESVLVPPAA